MNMFKLAIRIALNLAMLTAVVIMTQVSNAPCVYGGF